ncbi:hypothetical protein CMI45_01205 [Candidatus Pacearchaeota archaeon]|nr:hypothetical protein [Candidatus Pacearchaeota archaeon]|tara:strand:+ start:1616 stop:2197 length:582 start_codon:yes stop_codon:yes gene_type:complete
MQDNTTKSILNNRVLMLNKHWFPIGVSSLRNAFCKLLSERAKAINHNNYGIYEFKEWISIEDEKLNYLTTPSILVPVPEIIVFSYYDSVPVFSISSSRKNIFKRDKYICQYSGKKLSHRSATVDHVIPKSRGGNNGWKNCVTSSSDINNKKADFYLEETKLKLIRDPFVPRKNILFNLPYGFSLPESWKAFFV